MPHMEKRFGLSLICFCWIGRSRRFARSARQSATAPPRSAWVVSAVYSSGVVISNKQASRPYQQARAFGWHHRLAAFYVVISLCMFAFCLRRIGPGPTPLPSCLRRLFDRTIRPSIRHCALLHRSWNPLTSPAQWTVMRAVEKKESGRLPREFGPPWFHIGSRMCFRRRVLKRPAKKCATPVIS